MPSPSYFTEKAARCRVLLKVAKAPEVIEQLRLWVTEFDAQAKERAPGPNRRHAVGSRRVRLI